MNELRYRYILLRINNNGEFPPHEYHTCSRFQMKGVNLIWKKYIICDTFFWYSAEMTETHAAKHTIKSSETQTQKISCLYHCFSVWLHWRKNAHCSCFQNNAIYIAIVLLNRISFLLQSQNKIKPNKGTEQCNSVNM